jgi:rubredoxin
MCLICGWIYDEAEGDPEHGVLQQRISELEVRRRTLKVE